MPRSVLKLAYQAVPCAATPAFPAQTETHIPLLEIVLEHAGTGFRTVGIIDSGASRVLVPTDIAEALGIDWRNCPQTPVQGVAGSGIGYAADVRLIIVRANHGWPTRVVFTPGVDTLGVVLLGQDGFFDHCEVNFRGRAKEFKITL